MQSSKKAGAWEPGSWLAIWQINYSIIPGNMESKLLESCRLSWSTDCDGLRTVWLNSQKQVFFLKISKDVFWYFVTKDSFEISTKID